MMLPPDSRSAAAEDLARAGVRDARVEIVEYDPAWPAAFAVERERLTPLLPAGVELHHFGSTAVAGLAAKPVIDMIALVDDFDASIAALVSSAGYQYPAAFNATLTHRRFLCFPTAAHRTHHLHLVDESQELERRLRFRERLRADPALAREYVALKRALAERYRNDREAYTEAKGEFVKRCEQPTVPGSPAIGRRVVEPRRNIELKARDPNPDRSLRAALALGARDEGWLRQTDTYFRVPHGRLKLREEDTSAQLIAYDRADEALARESRYRLVTINDPHGLKESLSTALGVLVVVEKSRRLLLWQSVRIHLDEVRGLGSFIEIEAVADPVSDLTSERREANEVQEALVIAPEQIMAVSYSDELLRARVPTQ
jgi:predicted adenylyl cyclase CyaB